MTRLAQACLTVTVTVCLALGACGGESGSEVQAPKAGAGKDSGLGVKRFAALDRLFAAAVVGDKYVDQKPEDFSFQKYREDVKPLEQACDSLRADDALMRAIRSGCPLLTEVVKQTGTFGKCDSTAGCQRATRDFREVVKRLLAASRRSDRAVAAEKGLADACKQALTTPPKTYPVFEGYDAGLGLLERALRSPSPAALEKAQKRLAAADEKAKTLPTGKATLARFRSACD